MRINLLLSKKLKYLDIKTVSKTDNTQNKFINNVDHQKKQTFRHLFIRTQTPFQDINKHLSKQNQQSSTLTHLVKYEYNFNINYKFCKQAKMVCD